MITPKLPAAGWDTDPHLLGEKQSITHGRIIPTGQRNERMAPKRVDYLLSYRRDTPIAVVEAKASGRPAAEGLQQAKDYAEMLGVKFAYATNGHEIIGFDYTTGVETPFTAYPAPDALWRRYCSAAGIGTAVTESRLLTSCNLKFRMPPRYYQATAINRAVTSCGSTSPTTPAPRRPSSPIRRSTATPPEQRRIVAELDALESKVEAVDRLQAETATELEALLPAILDHAFKREL